MLTRCPTCTTTFRITPEQLKARLGRVRCGQCQAVFNALDALVEESSTLAPGLAGSNLAPPPSLPEPPPSVAAETEVDVLEETTVPAQRETEDAALTEPLPLAEDLAELAAEINAAQTQDALEEDASPSLPIRDEEGQAPADEAEEELTPDPEILAEEPNPPSLPQAETPPAPALLDTAFDALSVDIEPEPPIADAEAIADAEDLADPPPASENPATVARQETETLPVVEAFPDQADAPVAEHGLAPTEAAPDPEAIAEETPPPVAAPEPLLHALPRAPRRWPWLLGIAFGLLALVLQLVLHYRVELATLKPALKPALQALCQPLGCTVPLPNKIDLLSIESSDLHPTPRKGQLQLVAILKNTAPFAQELPLLEITLTDVADRVLIVKSLAPADYLPKDIPAEGGFPARKEINLNLSLDVGDTPAAGYRLYLYHP